MNAPHPYPHLLSPVQVGRHTLRNRVIMGSMHTRLEYLEHGVDREVAFYAERARGGAALIVTAGCSPNAEGCMEPGSHVLNSTAQLPAHQPITRAVHAEGAKMVLQILHAGRYAKHADCVAPSALRSHINRFTPRAMSEEDIERTLEDYVRCAELAREAGYDGVEVMGSEGYLITEFAALRTNKREDRWGGSLENRLRFGVEIARRIRAHLGPDFLLMFRMSALDLVEDGLTGDEIDQQARALEAAGVDILSTGIGWHEAGIPTIAYQVPRAAWRFAVARLKHAVRIPVVASNRINTPEVAEDLIASGDADLVALARPMLADPAFVAKAAAGRAEEINTCIACNQACLDYIFSNRPVSCLVNPRAGRELEFPLTAAPQKKAIAVVGAGPAGLSCAIHAARRGHGVTLFEASDELGGQLNVAKQVPDKQEFHELLRYLRGQIQALGIEVHLNTTATPDRLATGFDHIVIAAGIEPRTLDIPGIDHPKVAGYLDILLGKRVAGERVAIIGTGGIGHDVAEFLLDQHEPADREAFFQRWGVDTRLTSPGGLAAPAAVHTPRRITLFQRSPGKPGNRLGATTGWIHRSNLKRHGVAAISGCTYTRIDDQGLHYKLDGADRVAEVDTIVICAGQEPARALADQLTARGLLTTLIGGARVASELDAMRAIEEGMRLAYGF